MTGIGGIPSGPRAPASDTEATLQWAIGAINHGRPDDAERFALSVLAKIPQHPKALYLLGCALLQQNRAAQAVAPLEKAARSLQDPAVETQLAIALRQIGRTDDALLRLRRATKRRPVHAEAFHELAFLLFRLDQPDEAVTVIEHGRALAPETSELPILLGGIHHARRDAPNAKTAYAQALALAPDHPDAHYGMGAVLVDEAQYAQAAEHLQRSLSSNPADVQPRLKLGVCLLELGRTEDALVSFRDAVRGDPGVYRLALSLVTGSARGRFWIRPSAAARALSA